MLSLNKHLLEERHTVHTLVMCDHRLYPLLLCATITVIADNTTFYPSLPGVSFVTCDAKKHSNARRAIMPRLALRPVCLSSRSR